MKKTEIAWAAGFFDGEGCILIRSHHHEKYYSLEIKISQKRLAPLTYFAKLFGNGGSIWRSPLGVYQWSVEGAKAARILTIMYPYFQIKKEEADVAFKFREGVPPYQRWTDKQRLLSASFKQQLSDMKKEAYANG